MTASEFMISLMNASVATVVGGASLFFATMAGGAAVKGYGSVFWSMLVMAVLLMIATIHIARRL